ncbi:hypothetical protein SARC_08975 [Sphaeroforma arctica JP610]|uniref:DUF2254 domain-containing protein n=1 Tax=Sphaeroforma arctica JP610 TaxID=667725 RepID=A0A0L0FP69_9EUKA|nr:hypothetical protein SARC_08975 [Sphaeroforma arctica JP610]KNC78605.1 hypothetical protein SARC_08975 [Sphaeroforma arctica JP610]|eukprot:XP_014152507.1 hypothetical protein SARC_08975 [Sphaeroforma arctica JP610]
MAEDSDKLKEKKSKKDNVLSRGDSLARMLGRRIGGMYAFVTRFGSPTGLFYEAVHNQFWGLPLISIILNMCFGFGLSMITLLPQDSDFPDLQPYEHWWAVFLFTGTADSANSIMSLVASSAISIATLTFSLTVLAIQLAAVNYSPRLLDEFLKDPVAKRSFAVNLGTFTYCVVVMWNTRGSTNSADAFVPFVAVNVVMVHVFAVLYHFIYYLQYFISSIRLENILQKASKSAWKAARRLEILETTQDDFEIPNVPPGAYRCLATKSGSGDFVIEGTIVGWIWPMDRNNTRFRKKVKELVEYKRHNGINDPQTAVQCLDSLSVVFSRISRSKFPRTTACDSEDKVRAIAPVHDFPYILAICMDPIRQYGKADASVVRRAMYFLGDLGAIAKRLRLKIRVRAIKRQLKEWHRVAEVKFADDSMNLRSTRSVYEHARHSITSAAADRVPHNEHKRNHRQEDIEGMGDDDGNPATATSGAETEEADADMDEYQTGDENESGNQFGEDNLSSDDDADVNLNMDGPTLMGTVQKVKEMVGLAVAAEANGTGADNRHNQEGELKRGVEMGTRDSKGSVRSMGSNSDECALEIDS